MLDRRLNHVIAVAHFGSFTRAAQSLGMTQPGVTKSVADLERELGYVLFFRTANGAVPTENGRDFVDRAIRVLEDARTLLAGKRAVEDPFAQSLRIGVCPASLEWLLATPLTALRERHPSTRFELVASNFERVLQLLRTGVIDVALGFDELFSGCAEVQREQVSTMQSVFFVRKDHPILSEGSITSAVLACYDFVVPSDSRPYGSSIRGIIEESGDGRRHLHVIDYFPIVRRFVASSDVIGITTEEYSASPEFRAKFARVPGSPFSPAPICCVVRSRSEATAPVRAFLQAARAEIPPRI